LQWRKMSDLHLVNEIDGENGIEKKGARA